MIHRNDSDTITLNQNYKTSFDSSRGIMYIKGTGRIPLADMIICNYFN